MSTGEVKRGKAYTAPKGRPTVHATRGAANRRLSARVQWALAIVLFLIVLGVIFYVGRGFRTAGGGGALGGSMQAGPTTLFVDVGLLVAGLGIS